MYIRHGRVPLPGIYSPISRAFHPAYADETETSDVKVAPALGWVTVLPVPGNLGSWLISSERAVVLRFQARSLETVSTARCNGQGPDSSPKGVWMFVWVCVYAV